MTDINDNVLKVDAGVESGVMGMHHITAIASDARRNLEFYTKVLGLRLVKKTVNFDDPETYHFYFGNEAGEPGTILTFFPWEGISTGLYGRGMVSEIGYSVPGDSLAFWQDRFTRLHVQHGNIGEKFGEQYLPFTDPDGLRLQLISSKSPDSRKPWETADVTAGTATKGFHSISITTKEIEGTASVLTDILGYKLDSQEGNRYRFRTDTIGTANLVDLVLDTNAPAGYTAGGTTHHVAFRVKDDKILLDYREKILAKGFNITPKIDRDYFFSLYFREPGGVLFELATDNPGFTRDEPLDELGTHLKLPRQYEPRRDKIEAVLPKLD